MKIRRFAVAIVAAGIVLSSGVSYAQNDGPPAMPEKVRKFLDGRVGSWSVAGGPVRGTIQYKWDAEGKYIIGDAELMVAGKPHHENTLWRWDEISENQLIGCTMSSEGYVTYRGQVVSDTVAECQAIGITSGQKNFLKIRFELDGPNRYTTSFTNWTVGDQSRPDWTGTYTKIKPATREDFEEFCKLYGGRWMGEITWAADWAGYGKKGQTVTIYRQHTISQDGHAFVANGIGGKGTGMVLFYYDAGSQLIRGTGVSSGGSTSELTIRKDVGEWVFGVDEIEPDGTKVVLTITATFSDDGHTLTEKGIGTRGNEKVEFVDIWHRGSK